ncbi:hypothetical protein [Thioalkalivibrio sp. ALE16]|uniref:hypothetical protein n=1 Tax=Thioalkalivibrio sp. ALE16 TaxID=1158172 RepID=UPI0012DE8EEF|nr:hypothetical protein [Thioalkalivibrio sp. ALE16]
MDSDARSIDLRSKPSLAQELDSPDIPGTVKTCKSCTQNRRHPPPTIVQQKEP